VASPKKPFVWHEAEIGGRSKWYPHEALELLSFMRPPDVADMEWYLLDASDAGRWRDSIREIAERWAQFARLVAFIAEGRSAPICSWCGLPFYPSRSDARYCSDTCRQRGHRAIVRADGMRTSSQRPRRPVRH
jgi:hypothetical protein